MMEVRITRQRNHSDKTNNVRARTGEQNGLCLPSKTILLDPEGHKIETMMNVALKKRLSSLLARLNKTQLIKVREISVRIQIRAACIDEAIASHYGQRDSCTTFLSHSRSTPTMLLSRHP